MGEGRDLARKADFQLSLSHCLEKWDKSAESLWFLLMPFT